MLLLSSVKHPRLRNLEVGDAKALLDAHKILRPDSVDELLCSLFEKCIPTETLRFMLGSFPALKTVSFPRVSISVKRGKVLLRWVNSMTEIKLDECGEELICSNGWAPFMDGIGKCDNLKELRIGFEVPEEPKDRFQASAVAVVAAVKSLLMRSVLSTLDLHGFDFGHEAVLKALNGNTNVGCICCDFFIDTTQKKEAVVKLLQNENTSLQWILMG